MVVEPLPEEGIELPGSNGGSIEREVITWLLKEAREEDQDKDLISNAFGIYANNGLPEHVIVGPFAGGCIIPLPYMIPLKVSAVAEHEDLSALEWDDAFSPSIQPRQENAEENVHWRKISSKKFSCIINECGHNIKTFTSKASALQHLSSYHKIGDTSKTCRCGYTTHFKSKFSGHKCLMKKRRIGN